MTETIDLEIRQLLQNARSVAIVSHIRPDADAVGSLLGLGLPLLAAGKQVQHCCGMVCPKITLFPARSRQGHAGN